MQHQFIIALGFSAGGLAPLLTFFEKTLNEHVLYVILSHLPPHSRSMLGDILPYHSKLQVYEARDGMPLQPNKIYLLPAGFYMTIESGHLYLQPRIYRRLYPNSSIDIFLRSLSKENGSRSIAVILSGTGSDGTQGALAIKQSGGLVIAQKPQSCVYSSMPLNAIKTGSVKHELLPEDMPRVIQNHINTLMGKHK